MSPETLAAVGLGLTALVVLVSTVACIREVRLYFDRRANPPLGKRERPLVAKQGHVPWTHVDPRRPDAVTHAPHLVSDSVYPERRRWTCPERDVSPCGPCIWYVASVLALDALKYAGGRIEPGMLRRLREAYTDTARSRFTTPEEDDG